MAVLALAVGSPLAQAQSEGGVNTPQLEQALAAEGQTSALQVVSAPNTPRPARNPTRTTQAQREAAAARAKAAREAMAGQNAGSGRSLMAEPGVRAPKAAPGPGVTPEQGGVADTFGIYSNWANSPRNIRKFVNRLPGLGPAGVNDLLQYIPVAVADKVTYPGSDYYEIAVVEFSEQMHGDLPPTRLRGYVQLETAVITGSSYALPGGALGVDKPHYLGPAIVAEKDRPVRIKFVNMLPTGVAGKLFVPVDVSVMGAGPGPDIWNGTQDPEALCAVPQDQATPPGCFAENRATIHLHGGKTPWISDGTPHQWIVPAGEVTNYLRGQSVENVPDMPDPGPGAMTFYFTNQQSSRLMFYHDHASGITRLNVYVGEAAAYIITDATEASLVSSGVIPAAADTIPLVIQDKTFVDTTLVPNPKTTLLPGDPATVPAILATSPTWNWGTGALDPVTGFRTPQAGDLWWPHVYVAAQNPYDLSGVNPWGRWAYGPWFWPPTNNIQYPPVDNPYYDPTCNPFLTSYCQPPKMPDTPNASWGAEAFMDVPVVNGTVFPYLEVQPKAYRFRILNAAHDRFWNLQLYKADPTTTSTDGRTLTEVTMVPAIPPPAPTVWPEFWPADGREGGVPDPATKGPDWIQIGTEGGFLPRPAVVPTNPVYWNADPTTFNAGNVLGGSLILGPAERADVIVDFSQLGGQTLILYNDAPAAFPARDPRLDYYTGAPDLRDTGGVDTPQVGFAPNTRTIMQIRVAPGAGTAFSVPNLETAWMNMTPGGPSVFAAGQEPIIAAQPLLYNDVYATLPQPPYFMPSPAAPGTFNGVARIQDTGVLNFMNPLGQPVTINLQNKAIHDEMGATYDEYGRMSAKLGLEVPFSTAVTQTFILKNYVDPSTEIIMESMPGVATGADGTQIWKITHNGVDTHPVHFHIFDVQLLNRVGWDGAIRLPDANELGWKDTIRISPLEDTIVALRPVAPKLPFGIPDSERPMNPALPIGATVGFTNLDQFGQPLAVPTTNINANFGWEYVWHCHILSHEEADMMRPIMLGVARALPAAPVLSRVGTALPVDLAWTDATPVGPDPAAPLNLGNPANEIGFRVERAVITGGIVGPYAPISSALANATTYRDPTVSPSVSYNYRVIAFNAQGEVASNIVTVGSVPTAPAAPSNLTFAIQAGPQVQLNWTDNSSNETGFTVQRATNNTFTTGLMLFNVGANVVTYTDAAVVAGTTYYYRVVAVNGALQSGPSNTVTVAVPSAAGLVAPSNLTAIMFSASRQIVLNWTDNAGNETGFTIQKGLDAAFTGDTWTYSVGPNVTTYTNTTGVDPEVIYYFRVQATGPGGPTAWSNTATAGGPPTAPTTAVAAQVAGTTRVLLTWMDNSLNEAYFRIERSTNGGATWQLRAVSPAAAGTGTRSYTDTTTAAGVTYMYRVRAHVSTTSFSTWVVSNSVLVVAP